MAAGWCRSKKQVKTKGGKPPERNEEMSRSKVKRVALRQLSKAVYARRVGRFDAARVWYSALWVTCGLLASWGTGGGRSQGEWFAMMAGVGGC